ncbi:MAG: TonB-dependent receptor [Gemmatimonadaceae bacterium]|nr:TonB-dependent receptor [Gemmatimonadaceae bacterium]
MIRSIMRGVALTLCAALAHPLAAQTGAIAGKVSEEGSGRALAAARVQAVAPNRPPAAVATGEDGTYRLGNLAAGTYSVTVSRIGFQLKRFDGVVVAAGATATVNASMSEVATQLTSVVTTASRKPEKALDAPAQISIVTSERINERSALTVSDQIRNQPGVSVSQGGIAQANIVARGFNNAFSGSMLMLQDYRFAGVPSLRVNVPFLFTGTSEDIDRLEVLIGPASALYGPNSANGVLHVITKSPFQSKGTTLTLDGGERSIIRGGLRYAGANEKNTVGFKFSGEYMRGNDWEYRDPSEPTTFPANAPQGRAGQRNARNFDVDRYTAEARLDLRPIEGLELISTYGRTHIGSFIELTGANGAAQGNGWVYQNFQQRVRYKRFFGQVFANLSNAGNDNSNSLDGTYLLRSGQPIVDKSRVIVGQLQHGFTAGKFDFTYGTDYIATQPNTGNTINGANEGRDNVNEFGAYVQSTFDITNKLQLLGAYRVDANNVIEGQQYSPRAALIFKPTNTQNMRVTYNRAFNTPANFTFFLDLVQARDVGGSRYDIYAQGNPPKTGLQFNRSCAGAGFGNFCMKSPLAGNGAFVPASAASAFPGLVAAQRAAFTAGITPAVGGALQQFGAQLIQGGLPAAAVNAAVAALSQSLPGTIINGLAAARPTDAQLSSRVAYLTSGTVNLTPEQVTDVIPLGASFNDTWELGYKGIIGNRFRYDASFWYQKRGDLATTASVNTPNVFFGNPTQLGGYLGANMGGTIGQTIGQALVAAGVPAAQANTLAAQFAGQLAPGLAGALTPTLARAPLGLIQYNGDFPANRIYATYLNTKARPLYVHGLDLATDFVVSDRLTLEGTVAYMNRNVFAGVPGGNGLDLHANSPRMRFSAGGRWSDERRGFSMDGRMRYAQSYPVNSGVYISNFAFAIPPGSPGAVTNPDPTRAGAGQCPPAAGYFCYESVPAMTQFDLTIAKRFEVNSQRFLWSITGTNLTNQLVNTFPGVPEVGRLVMTRIQYSF